MGDTRLRGGNTTWVCFHCREAVRRPAGHAKAVPCPKCRQDCQCLGTKIRIPSKEHKRAWQELRMKIRDSLLSDVERRDRVDLRLRHRLERQISELEAAPSSEEEIETLQRLKEQLASL
jgi:hypothetical protein